VASGGKYRALSQKKDFAIDALIDA
jgi:hypothetical protein